MRHSSLLINHISIYKLFDTEFIPQQHTYIIPVEISSPNQTNPVLGPKKQKGKWVKKKQWVVSVGRYITTRFQMPFSRSLRIEFVQSVQIKQIETTISHPYYYMHGMIAHNNKEKRLASSTFLTPSPMTARESYIPKKKITQPYDRSNKYLSLKQEILHNFTLVAWSTLLLLSQFISFQLGSPSRFARTLSSHVKAWDMPSFQLVTANHVSKY